MNTQLTKLNHFERLHKFDIPLHILCGRNIEIYRCLLRDKLFEKSNPNSMLREKKYIIILQALVFVRKCSL